MNRMDVDEEDNELDNNNLAEDDNAQVESEEHAPAGEDPLLLAIDDLEGRVVSALDEVKLHSGVFDTTTTTAHNIHELLAQLLRPVLEVSCHTGPSVARTYSRGEGLDDAVEDVYERLVSDLVLPVLLEMAQSDPTAAKRGAALEFLKSVWKEAHKAGSWLDGTTANPASSTTGPYGSGSTSSSSSSSHHHAQAVLPPRHIQMRRKEKRLARENEVLRYWLQAAIACLQPGVFTAQAADHATAARGVLAASAALRPALRHIVQRIKEADDRGANRLYTPVMKLIELVLQKLLLSSDNQAPDSLVASCIKFVEIVVLCCSRKPPDPVARRRGAATTSATPQQDFSLEDLPEGHPIITREALESIADYAFTVLRGFTMLGGQVKIDANVLSGMMMSGGSPSEQVVNILRPAGLAYLELESNFPSLFHNDADKSSVDGVNLETNLDRVSLEFDFRLTHKPYSVAIQALAALATHRPAFFQEAATCLSRRTFHPPSTADEGATLLTDTGVKALKSQLKSSCLTLLRNALSVSTNSFAVLQRALQAFDMQQQAEKALAMAKQAHSLKTAGRAARNRANTYYAWETSTDGATKRQRETDDALAKMRAAKAARGLGHGIQLPSSMSEAVDLILVNLEHLPTSRPPTGTSDKSRKYPVSLELVIDAVMTNGASLSQEEGRWYDRDGGGAWDINLDDADNENQQRFCPSQKFLDVMDLVRNDDPGASDEEQKKQKLYREQAARAASDAFGRILTNSVHSRSDSLASFGRSIASRLAFTLCHTPPLKDTVAPVAAAQASVARVEKDADHVNKLQEFVDLYPLAAASLAFDADQPVAEHGASTENGGGGGDSLALHFLNEALLQQDAGPEDPYYHQIYDYSLDVHVAASVRSSLVANEKPSDLEKKKTASQAVASLQRDLPKLPRLTSTSVFYLASLCDIEAITKKAKEKEAKKGSSQEAIAEAATVHAAKVAAEKRATAALLILRDIAFQREEDRAVAVQSSVGIATGRFPSSPVIQGKALKMVINVLYSRNKSLESAVVDAATEEIDLASEIAVSKFDAIEKANKENKNEATKKPLSPWSETEKQVMDRMRKPVILFMALCIRKTDLIGHLFRKSSVEKADVLAKTVKSSMPKVAQPAATLHGAASIAFDVASMTGKGESPLLLAFMESLPPDQDLIDACFKIQDSKADANGEKDPRYIIPVLLAMKRSDLVGLLPSFVMADDDKTFLGALRRMGAKVARQALLFRDEPDSSTPSLQGMTLCEQIVELHRLDFVKAKIPQKRYLSAIKLCLEDDETYNDRVLMSALDQISGVFLTGAEKLPLAFMRTAILVSTKHESLHTWIAQVLLPRLVDGKIYEDARQWEGWMRCAHMLETSGDSGVQIQQAIQKLPPEQLMQYKSKWQR